MNRKVLLFASIFTVAVVSFAAVYSYENYFGAKIVRQTNHDNVHCRQGNVLEGVDRQARFTVLSPCEQVVGIVHNMTGIKEEDGDYQFNLVVQKPYRKLAKRRKYQTGARNVGSRDYSQRPKLHLHPDSKKWR